MAPTTSTVSSTHQNRSFYVDGSVGGASFGYGSYGSYGSGFGYGSYSPYPAGYGYSGYSP